MKPFLKWAGNKQRILEHIQGALPEGDRLIEPFVGSGAVFLNTEYDRYLLCDSNQDLINLYNTLKKEGETFIRYCKRYFTAANNTEEAYYRLRERFNNITDSRQRSALFVYFNRHGYNGLCRYNRKGAFNVPFGRYNKPYFPEKEMRFFRKKSRRAVFRHSDFEDTMDRSRRGDVVYCDPPYVPLSPSASFVAFSPGGFGMDQQAQLAQLAEVLSERGIPVIISNHDTPYTQAKYRGADIRTFDVRRFISCNGSRRNMAGELLAIFS